MLLAQENKPKDLSASQADSLAKVAGTRVSILPVEIIGVDTIPYTALSQVLVLATRPRSTRDEVEYKALKNNVMKVYPYAVRAIKLLDEIEVTTSEMERKREKKKYLHKLEDELKDTFKGEIKDLTTTQGKILMKILERYTGKTTFELIKQLKNPISAFFWQNASKSYGYDLKEGYNPEKYRDLEAVLVFLEQNGYENITQSKALKQTEKMNADDFIKKKDK